MTEQSKNDLIALIQDALTGKCLTMGKDCIKKEDVAIWIADEFERRKLYFNITPIDVLATSSRNIQMVEHDPAQLNLIDQIEEVSKHYNVKVITEVEGMNFDRDDVRKGKGNMFNAAIKSLGINPRPILKIKLVTPMPITNDASIMGKWKNFTPEYAKTNDACFDCRADFNFMDRSLLTHGGEILNLHPGERILIPLGFSAELPVGYKATLHMRSGLAIKQGLMMVNGRGTIDNGYRGVWGAIVYNSGKETIIIKHGDRICQGELERYEQCDFEVVDTLSDTDRGEGGYGHTGKS